MDFSFSGFSWGAVGASIVAGQAISTVWFVALFEESWAKEYGAADKKQHTPEIPPYTYGVQLLCTVLLVLSLAMLHRWLAVDSLGDALAVAVMVIVGFSVATGLPGQAFLKRWRVAAIAYGSQAAMILGISVILGLWR
jgi:hypothetical protein